MKMEFKCQIEKRDPKSLCLFVEGYFDEASQLPIEVDFDGIENFYINFSKIEFINSGGIKLWIKFITPIAESYQPNIFFEDCQRIIIDQLNIVQGFLPENGKVLSLHAPLFCENCENEYTHRVEANDFDQFIKDGMDDENPPKWITCPACGESGEFDFVPDLFFRFRKRNQ